jgi:myosin-5
MTALAFLHEPGVLWNLKSRYLQDKIYTYTGNILIAINPFAPLPHYYGQDVMAQYRDREVSDLEPHVFAVASSAYRNMRLDKQGQAILVRGGSCSC